MIISHTNRFVFIKTKKTAGTSIEIELSKHCGPEDIITPITPKDEIQRVAYGGRAAQNFTSDKALADEYQKAALSGKRLKLRRLRRHLQPEDYYNHMSISEVKERCGSLSDYFWFTAERNPYDRIISFIYWTKKPSKTISSARRAYYVLKYAASAEFQNFHLYSVRGKIAVDEIINYDHLETQFALVCDRIGIQAPERLIATKNTQRKCRSKALSRFERSLVRHYCSKEMAALSNHA